MEILIALSTFIAVTLAAYGLMYRGTGNPILDARLSGLRYERQGRDNLPDPNAAFSARVIRPLVQGAASRVNGLLPSAASTKIEGALDKISPEHRETIVLREVNGLEYKEIAVVMECSIGTVMSRLFYARKKLQTLLTNGRES